MSDEEMPLTELVNFAQAMMGFEQPRYNPLYRRMAAEVERHPELGELSLNAGHD